MNRFRPNRFRIATALLVLVALAVPGAGSALEFSGPIVVTWNDDLLCGTVVPTADGARQQVVIGTAAGWVRLLRPSGSIAESFSFLGQLYAQGRVVSMIPWEGRAPGSPGVVICTTDPDRVIFAEVLPAYPYINRVGSVDLVEDPGQLAFLDDPEGNPGTVAVSLPGIDEIVLLGQSGGTWAVEATLAAGDRPVVLVSLDLDDDSERELLSVNQGVLSHSLGRYDRLPDGSYELTRTLPVGGAPGWAHALDWDGDGRQEVFVALTDSARVVGFDAAGTALVERTRVDLPFTPDHFSLVAEGAGRAAVYSCARDLQFVHHGTATDSAVRGITYYPGGTAEVILPCDFNGDLIADLTVLGGEGRYASIMYGKPDGSHWGFPALDLPAAAGPALLADLDGDGDGDLAVAGYGEQQIAVFELASGGGLEYLPTTTSVGCLVGALAAIQLDGDPARELAAYDIGGARVILYDVVDGRCVARGELATQSSWSGLIAADLDGDGLDDLLGYSRSTRSIAAYFGLGGAAFSERVDWTLGQAIGELACLDLNGDRRLDLVHSDGISKVWFATNPEGRALGEPDYVYAGAGAEHLAAGDFDHDGDADIVVGNEDDDSISILENPGTGVLIRRVGSFSLTWSFNDVMCADLDGLAGDEVLLLQRDRQSLGVSFPLGDWQFTPASEFPLYSVPYRVLTADVNGDGASDLLALDNVNRLGYALLNAVREIVGTDEPILQVRCNGEEMEIRVQPDQPGAWQLDLVAGAERVPLASSDGARVGTQDYEQGEWLHRVPVAALPGLAGAARPVLRWMREAGDGSEQVELAVPTGCLQPTRAAAGLDWVRRPGPNPFNPRVACELRLARAEDLTVDVYDLAGRHVRRIAEGRREAGDHIFVWEGDGPDGRVAAGTYFVLARTESAQLIGKVLLLK